ncbi:spore coat protein Z [Thalassobacillus cyri]|uniref:Spore coat protein Z n=1 Tax=Thalassobacillus cyri TaxID=571932 RepID=A0A1H3ZB70_9BACI|nr:CotY/CotZ family spore coat protein [Thalassobacillus cyri]SEA20758.1 spore coat protein Z [Thalassobacillus cyri]
MSCGGGKDFDNCVCETVREIIKAQDEVAGVGDDCCDTGCEQSIRDLLSPVGNGNGPTTIPFSLICKGDCEPFIGRSVVFREVGMSDNATFNCVETPIFRAKKFVDEDECCVQLELLVPVTQGQSTPGPGGDDFCAYFPGNSIRNFVASGLCITVDLDCFCGIACLDPVTPLPSSELPLGNGGGSSKH